MFSPANTPAQPAVGDGQAGCGLRAPAPASVLQNLPTSIPEEYLHTFSLDGDSVSSTDTVISGLASFSQPFNACQPPPPEGLQNDPYGFQSLFYPTSASFLPPLPAAFASPAAVYTPPTPTSSGMSEMWSPGGDSHWTASDFLAAMQAAQTSLQAGPGQGHHQWVVPTASTPETTATPVPGSISAAAAIAAGVLHPVAAPPTAAAAPASFSPSIHSPPPSLAHSGASPYSPPAVLGTPISNMATADHGSLFGGSFVQAEYGLGGGMMDNPWAPPFVEPSFWSQHLQQQHLQQQHLQLQRLQLQHLQQHLLNGEGAGALFPSIPENQESILSDMSAQSGMDPRQMLEYSVARVLGQRPMASSGGMPTATEQHLTSPVAASVPPSAALSMGVRGVDSVDIPASFPQAVMPQPLMQNIALSHLSPHPAAFSAVGSAPTMVPASSSFVRPPAPPACHGLDYAASFPTEQQPQLHRRGYSTSSLLGDTFLSHTIPQPYPATLPQAMPVDVQMSGVADTMPHVSAFLPSTSSSTMVGVGNINVAHHSPHNENFKDSSGTTAPSGASVPVDTTVSSSAISVSTILSNNGYRHHKPRVQSLPNVPLVNLQPKQTIASSRLLDKPRPIPEEDEKPAVATVPAGHTAQPGVVGMSEPLRQYQVQLRQHMENCLQAHSAVLPSLKPMPAVAATEPHMVMLQQQAAVEGAQEGSSHRMGSITLAEPLVRAAASPAASTSTPPRPLAKRKSVSSEGAERELSTPGTPVHQKSPRRNKTDEGVNLDGRTPKKWPLGRPRKRRGSDLAAPGPIESAIALLPAPEPIFIAFDPQTLTSSLPRSPKTPKSPKATKSPKISGESSGSAVAAAKATATATATADGVLAESGGSSPSVSSPKRSIKVGRPRKRSKFGETGSSMADGSLQVVFDHVSMQKPADAPSPQQPPPAALAAVFPAFPADVSMARKDNEGLVNSGVDKVALPPVPAKAAGRISRQQRARRGQPAKHGSKRVQPVSA